MQKMTDFRLIFDSKCLTKSDIIKKQDFISNNKNIPKRIIHAFCQRVFEKNSKFEITKNEYHTNNSDLYKDFQTKIRSKHKATAIDKITGPSFLVHIQL